MNKATYNTFCNALPATTHVVQWAEADVWKVGGKVFAIGNFGDGQYAGITFKTSELTYDILKDQKGLRPAPYLASRGMKWIQMHEPDALSDTELQDYICEAHRIISLKLTKKLQKELGLNQS